MQGRMTGPQGDFQCSLLSCSDSWQLSELCACLVPQIWIGRATTEPIRSIYASASKRSINTGSNVFKQFCYKIFRHTQISAGCILLALYYLQQLKSIYPTLRSTLGSEFRIFTTALILANKYLDDNTFTNKTWSEVSGIPIHELNIMEMEYLTALNYKLHVHCLRFCSWANQCQQWFQSPPPPLLKRSSSVNHYLALSHPYQQKPNHHHRNSSSQRIQQRLKSYEPLHPLSHTASMINAMYNSDMTKKKRKRALSPPSQPCHTYLPTPPTKPLLTTPSLSSSLSSMSISPPIIQTSCSTKLQTPMMSWSSSMPTIPYSGATAAANAAAYVTYHHHHHHHHHHYHPNPGNTSYAISSNLVSRIRCLEIE